MSPVQNHIILNQLRWRYATQHFDPTKKISEEDWKILEEALVLTPSSFGLQPWKFIVVTNSDLRVQLQSVSWDQPQITDASHLVVFAPKKKVHEQDVHKLIDRISHIRSISKEELSDYQNSLLEFVQGNANKQAWATRQACVALGSLVTVAALMGIDACPMEGFSKAEYDRILGLEETDYGAISACALGYRSAEDRYANLEKVRYEVKDVIEHR